MDLDRLGRGELIAGVGGVIFAISALFLDWFSVGGDLGDLGGAVGVDVGATGFQAADFLRDLIYVATIIVAVGLAVAKAGARDVSLPVAASALTAGLGILTTLLVLYRVIDPGPEGINRDFGLWVGLIGAGIVAYGGWLAMQEEGTSFGEEADRLGDQVGPPDDRGGQGGPPQGGQGGPPQGGSGSGGSGGSA